ncbi:MAG: DUF2958 domain-containing protein [Candidatus Omnitrophota bacterium]|jgi:hypothetical protein
MKGADMWNKPSSEDLAKIPAFYSSEETPLKEKMIHLHFFIGGCDWYAAEYSSEERCFFGFAILNGDLQNAEWGYFSLRELSELKIDFLEIDRDLYFKPCRAVEIEKIREAQEWKLETTQIRKEE